MKKKVVKIFAIIIVLACLTIPLFFLLPEKETTTQLEAPTSCLLSVLNDGRVELSTQENENATAYVFAICDNILNSNDSNFYIKIESITNTVDVTDYFNGNKTYYYYAYYKGTGIFTNSEKCDTSNYVSTTQLSTPTNFSREGTVLGWDPVPNAVSYTVFNGTDVVITQTARTFDFGNMLEDKTALYFQVRANGSNNYINSAKTQVVSYILHVQLATPTNLTINGTGPSIKLNWNAVENASTYTVKINNTREIITSTNSLNLSTYMIELGPYSFKVKTNRNQNYLESAYSSASQTYTKRQQLPSPTGLHMVKNSQFLEISWNAVSNATSYTIKINGQEYTNITSTTYSINTAIILPNENLSYEIQLKSIASGYYLNSSYGVLNVYAGHTQFSAPTNLSVSKTNGVVTASWQAVENATSYTVLIDDKIQLKTLTNNITLTNVCDLPQSYNVQVKVNANEEQMIISSAYTKVFEYKNLIALATPTNFEVSSDGTYLNYTFTAPQNSVNFTLLANGNIVNNNITTEITRIALNLLPSSTSGQYIFGLKANANGYYSESSVAQTEQKTLISTPNDIVAERDDSSVYIAWSPVQDATSYLIYINDVLISNDIITYNTLTSVNILLSDILNATNYTCKLCAVSTASNVLNSAFSPNMDIEYNQKRSVPKNLMVSKINNSYVATWDTVVGATGYTISLNNSIYNSNTNNFTLDSYISLNKIYSVRVRALGNNVDSNSNFSSVFMLNTTQNFVPNYSDKYFYMNGWNDFNIENDEELNKMVLYLIYEMPSEFKYYSNYNNSISNEKKFEQALTNIQETQSISYSSQENKNTHTLKIYNVNHIYKQSGANTSLKTTHLQMENAGYNFDTQLKSHQISEQQRAENYNDFAIENSLIEVNVQTSNQLYKAVEGGAKPIIDENNTHLLNVYNTAKQLLREIITDDMNEYEKAHAIFDWIVDNCYYDYLTVSNIHVNRGSYNCFYIEGVLLDKVAVCDGFSKTFALLCGMEGIKCIKVGGEANEGDHAWNKICLNVDGSSKWYGVDITWSNLRVKTSEQENTYKQILSHKYFLLNDTEMNIEHQEIGDYPAALGTKNYYDLELYDGTHSLNIKTKAELNTLVNYMVNNKKTLLNPDGIEGFEFKYFDIANYSSHLSEALGNKVLSYSKIRSDSTIIVLFL